MSYLTVNDAKEELSVAYVHAIAAHRRLYAQVVGKDRDSIDVEVRAIGLLASDSVLKSPHLGLQLKATTNVDASGDSFSFALSLKNYDDLRSLEVHIPVS